MVFITLLITGFCAHLVGMLVVRSDDFPLRDNPAGVVRPPIDLASELLKINANIAKSIVEVPSNWAMFDGDMKIVGWFTPYITLYMVADNPPQQMLFQFRIGG